RGLRSTQRRSTVPPPSGKSRRGIGPRSEFSTASAFGPWASGLVYAIPFLNVSISAAVTVTLTGFGLLPPFAARSAPSPRAPPDAETCADCFSGAVVVFRLPTGTPFFGSSFFSASLPPLGEPARPADPSVTTAIDASAAG